MLERVKEVGNLGRGGEHKPGTKGNVGSAVKQHAEITGHDIHPNYANILKTGMNNKNKRLFLESLHSFLDKNSVNEKNHLSQGFSVLVIVVFKFHRATRESTV